VGLPREEGLHWVEVRGLSWADTAVEVGRHFGGMSSGVAEVEVGRAAGRREVTGRVGFLEEGDARRAAAEGASPWRTVHLEEEAAHHAGVWLAGAGKRQKGGAAAATAADAADQVVYEGHIECEAQADATEQAESRERAEAEDGAKSMARAEDSGSARILVGVLHPLTTDAEFRAHFESFGGSLVRCEIARVGGDGPDRGESLGHGYVEWATRGEAEAVLRAPREEHAFGPEGDKWEAVLDLSEPFDGILYRSQRRKMKDPAFRE